MVIKDNVHGKLVGQVITFAPKWLEIDGKVVLRPTRAQYLSKGWKKVITTTRPERKLREGLDWVMSRGQNDSCIYSVWEVVKAPPPPPRTFRRSWLAQWLRVHGKWDAFKALLSQSQDLEFFWETSTEFDENHPMWDDAVSGMKAALQLTDLEVQEFLEYGATGLEPDKEESNG